MPLIRSANYVTPPPAAIAYLLPNDQRKGYDLL